MKRWLSLAALALPVLGLTISAGWHQWRQSGAAEWRIPVTGYDPRDLLAGHYARFRYAWRLEGQCPSGDCMFCLEDRRGEVVARIEPKASQCLHRVDPGLSGINVNWPAPGSRQQPVASGRIFIDEREAARITRLLGREKGAILVARLGGNRLVAQRVEAGP